MTTTKRKPAAVVRLERTLSDLEYVHRQTHAERDELKTRLEVAHRDCEVATGENGILRQLLEQISAVANGSPFFPVALSHSSAAARSGISGAGYGHTPVGSGDPMYGESFATLKPAPEWAQAEYNLEQQQKAVEQHGRLMAIAALCQTASRAITS